MAACWVNLFFQTEVFVCYTQFSFLDSTLTYSNVVDVVKTVPVGMGKRFYSYYLESCLITPDTLIDSRLTKEEYREKVIKYWLETSPHATWEDLGRELLLYEHKQAFKRAKRYIQPYEGT